MRHPLPPLHLHPSITSPLERKTESSCFLNDTACELWTTDRIQNDLCDHGPINRTLIGPCMWRCPSFPIIPALLGTKSLPTVPLKLELESRGIPTTKSLSSGGLILPREVINRPRQSTDSVTSATLWLSSVMIVLHVCCHYDVQSLDLSFVEMFKTSSTDYRHTEQ